MKQNIFKIAGILHTFFLKLGILLGSLCRALARTMPFESAKLAVGGEREGGGALTSTMVLGRTNLTKGQFVRGGAVGLVVASLTAVDASINVGSRDDASSLELFHDRFEERCEDVRENRTAGIPGVVALECDPECLGELVHPGKEAVPEKTCAADRGKSKH